MDHGLYYSGPSPKPKALWTLVHQTLVEREREREREREHLVQNSVVGFSLLRGLGHLLLTYNGRLFEDSSSFLPVQHLDGGGRQTLCGAAVPLHPVFNSLHSCCLW